MLRQVDFLTSSSRIKDAHQMLRNVSELDDLNLDFFAQCFSAMFQPITCCFFFVANGGESTALPHPTKKKARSCERSFF